MKRVLILVFLMLSACVQLPEEEITISDPVEEAMEPEQAHSVEPFENATPLAPLPEPQKNATPPPSSPLPQPMPQQKSMPSGWTTEPISMGEGETKVVYVKQ